MNTFPRPGGELVRALLIFSRPTARLVATMAAGFLLCAGANEVAAATCTVDAAGGAQFTTIQAAVDDANCTDIQVAAGDYYEHVTIARDVTIGGADAASTIVDGMDTGRVFTINGGTVTLNDLTVKNGMTAHGADWVGLHTTTTVHRGRGGDGGGILNAGSLTLNRVTVTDNKTGNGGKGGDISCDVSRGAVVVRAERAAAAPAFPAAAP